ncbi:uncharacterized protein LOC119981084 isoform X2 [Tripterygium wilfordii]|uniref:uncharacterized protein LOC119981084 isoform X2 n=1 Tax=Tripterygium wilfordii TaxID=458696 RepID=UPI0018F8136A|nr:uncharacterized protein LOC119981084 isoform X2 [Tripterygium wilfordii]
MVNHPQALIKELWTCTCVWNNHLLSSALIGVLYLSIEGEGVEISGLILACFSDLTFKYSGRELKAQWMAASQSVGSLIAIVRMVVIWLEESASIKFQRLLFPDKAVREIYNLTSL